MRANAIPRSTLEALRRNLVARQRALFDNVDGVEEDLRAIEESREAEIETRGQQEAMDRLLDRIRERDRHALEEIYRALAKIPTGAFGTCEGCGEPIPRARLEAIPESRYCVDCATERELAPAASSRPFEPGAHRAVPEEYRDLDDDELAEAVRERLQVHGDPDLDAVGVRCHGRVVRLFGTIPGEPQRQVLRQIITDGMGLEVIDRLRPAGIERELGGETEREAEEEGPPTEERIAAGRGMQPLRPERPGVPEDEGEPPETPPVDPIAEKE
jgi:DnaK suppressor protein